MVNHGLIVILLLAFILFSCTTENQLNELYVSSEYEIPDYENQQWVNSKPLSIGGLLGQGNIVLVDFWTYTCVNCIRTFPFLAEWHDKYSDKGLVIIGVHTPEFEFEKIYEKLMNFGHHDEFEKSGLNIEKIKKFVNEKKIFFNHFADKSKIEKWDYVYKLKKIDNKFLPKYLIDNSNKYKDWFD